MGKGENVSFPHFLLFPQCFQKAAIPEAGFDLFVRSFTLYQHYFSFLTATGQKSMFPRLLLEKGSI